MQSASVFVREKCRMDKELLERKATNKRCLFRENYLDSFFFHFVERIDLVESFLVSIVSEGKEKNLASCPSFYFDIDLDLE